MHRVDIEFQGGHLKLNGYPEAESVISLEADPAAQQLADLMLHNSDLDFAHECLRRAEEIEGDEFLTSVYWKIAIIHFFKCFRGNQSRQSHLDIETILAGDSYGVTLFQYYRSLRNKNVVHDDNPFDQAQVGAVINKADSDLRVAEVFVTVLKGQTHSEGDFSNLTQLIQKSKQYIQRQFDQIADDLKAQLEKQSHASLMALPGLTYVAPRAEDVDDCRLKSTKQSVRLSEK